MGNVAFNNKNHCFCSLSLISLLYLHILFSYSNFFFFLVLKYILLQISNKKYGADEIGSVTVAAACLPRRSSYKHVAVTGREESNHIHRQVIKALVIYFGSVNIKLHTVRV